MDATQHVSIISNDKKWLSSSVTAYRGPLDQVQQYIPMFERRTFGPELLPSEKFGEDNLFMEPHPPGFNRNYDVIVRMPMHKDDVEVPVGIVSKQYSLIQNRSLFEEAIKGSENCQDQAGRYTSRTRHHGIWRTYEARAYFPGTIQYEG